MISVQVVTILVLFIIQRLDGSKLASHHHHSPHRDHLNHHHPQLPHVSIGPYKPWNWDKKLISSLEEHQPTKSASLHHQPHHHKTEGLETNIIIDPHTKVSIVSVYQLTMITTVFSDQASGGDSDLRPDNWS